MRALVRRPSRVAARPSPGKRGPGRGPATSPASPPATRVSATVSHPVRARRPLRAGPGRPARQRGVSLVEVLVSLFIVSMGVLALAGLLSLSSRLAKAGESRAQAVLLAGDLADRVRANAPGALAGGYDWRPAAYPAHVGPPPVPAVLEPQCSASSPCSPVEVAGIDLYRWRQRLAASLPGGYGYVQSRPATEAGDATVDVWVAWTDAGSLVYGDALPAFECPAAFGRPGASGTPRCVHLQVSP